MITEDAAGGGAGLPSSGDIRALSTQIGVMHDALRKVWAALFVAVAVALGLGIWTAVQQVRIDGLEQQTASAARHDAAFARLNCESGNRYKAGVRQAFADFAPLVAYRSRADAVKAAGVAAELRVTTAPRDCAHLSLDSAPPGR